MPVGRHTAESRRIRNAESTIGCIILQDPFFLGQRDWLPPPADFSPNPVVGKTYEH